MQVVTKESLFDVENHFVSRIVRAWSVAIAG